MMTRAQMLLQNVKQPLLMNAMWADKDFQLLYLPAPYILIKTDYMSGILIGLSCKDTDIPLALYLQHVE